MGLIYADHRSNICYTDMVKLLVLARTTHVLREETSYTLHIKLPLLILRHMARLRKRVPLHLTQTSEVRLENAVLRFIESRVQEQRWHVDLVYVIDDRPCLQRPSDVELRWSIPTGDAVNALKVEKIRCGVHGEIHSGVLLELPKRSHDVLGHRVEATYMATIEDVHGVMILLGVRRTVLLMLRQGVL